MSTKDDPVDRDPSRAPGDSNALAKSRAVKDGVLVTLAIVLSTSFLISIDFVESLFHLTRDHEHWELDELLVGIVPAVAAMAWYAMRRWRDAKALSSALTKSVEELQTIQRALTEAHRRAEAASDAKSAFLTRLSHELRTPTCGIVGMTRLLLPTKLSEEQRRYMEAIEISGDSLLALLDDVLDLSKIEAGKIRVAETDFSPVQLVDSLATLWGWRFRDHGHAFDVDVTSDMPAAVKGDPGRLRQILNNLLSNALKFTEQGKVSLAAVCQAAPGGRYELCFSVTDSGIGIEPHLQERLFEEFVQGDAGIAQGRDGSGLGLTIARELAQLMDGDLTLESVPGEGSTFTLTVQVLPGDPAAIDGARDASQLVAAEDAVPEPGLRILLAEDNQVNQAFVCAILERAGHRVVVVANGAEAVDAVRRSLFDVLLMDIEMPRMDGLRATRLIRALDGQASSIPIIALTANTAEGCREKFISAGMDDYVAKPIDSDLLIAAIQRQLHCRSCRPSRVAKAEA